MRSFLILAISMLLGTQVLAQGNYRIQPGDVLEISVLEDSNLNRQVLVRPDGGISMPIVGNIRAGGNTISAIERIVTERLASGFSITPTVSVALSRLADKPDPDENNISIYLVGQVSRPGELWLGRFAADSRIQLRRAGRDGQERIFLFDYNAVERGARIETNIRVQNGDVILVPERRLFE